MKYLFKFYVNVQRDAEGRWLGFSGYQTGHELKLAYGGSVEADSDLVACERLFERFNINHPSDYRDRSMSVGDVVVLHSVKSFSGVAYSCESFGFKPIEGFQFTCDVRLAGYQRISGQPHPVRCTLPRGHDGNHSDQLDGTPVDWSGDGTVTHIEDPRVIISDEDARKIYEAHRP